MVIARRIKWYDTIDNKMCYSWIIKSQVSLFIAWLTACGHEFIDIVGVLTDESEGL